MIELRVPEYCLRDDLLTHYLGLQAAFRSRSLRIGTRNPRLGAGLSGNGLQVGDELDGGTERSDVTTVEIGAVTNSRDEAEL